MEMILRRRKFKQIFESLFNTRFQLNSYACEELIKYLELTTDKCTKSLFCDLLLSSLANLHTLTNSGKIFVLKILTAVAVKNELNFSKLTQKDEFHILVQHLQQTPSHPADLMHTNVMLATALSSHCSGVMWLIEFQIWMHLINSSIHAHPKKVANAACAFISKFVWKLDEYKEEAILTEVLGLLIEPIKTCKYMTIQEIDKENERELYEEITPQINSLLAIVRDFNKYENNMIFKLLFKYFVLHGLVNTIVKVTHSTELTTNLTELSYLIFFGYCRHIVDLGRDKSEIPNGIISVYYNITMCLLSKRMTTEAISFCVKCAIIWDKTDTQFCASMFERNGRRFAMRNQFIPIVVASILTYANYFAEQKHVQPLVALDAYLHISKEGSTISEHVVKAAYFVRDNTEMGDRKKIVIHNLKELSKLKGCLDMSQASLVHEALFCLLHVHVLWYCESPGEVKLLNSPEDITILSLTMEGIKMIMTEHNLNWYESIETICLQQNTTDMLETNFMPTRLLVQTIDLIDMSVRLFISPEMTLLMEAKSNSSLTQMCSILSSYIQHEEWEVRDSALQLLYTCLGIAFVKYTPLQKLILENGLVILAAKVALEDEQFYVQTTALRCLASAIKIQSIWKEVVADNSQLYTQLIHMLHHHEEGIVRTEIANVLTEIYVNQKPNTHFTTLLLQVMSDAVLNDSHWEVQIAALNFWQSFIKNQMSHRGMIDGKFPSVTFSKEKRKIVVLNANEIIRQLQGMMRQLASSGCLTVLHECLNGDFSMNVTEKAYKIANELVKQLEWYKYETDDGDVIMKPELIEDQEMKGDIKRNDYTSEALDLSASPRDGFDYREATIDQILNEDFSDLIAERYKSTQVKIRVKEPFIPKPLVNLIGPKEFLRDFKNSNYVAEIESRRNWGSKHSLDDILDEILISLERN